MAVSGTLNSSAYNGRYLKFSWTATQDVATNKSTISWTLTGAGNADVGYYKAGGFKVVIDGSTVYSTSTDTRIQLRDGTKVASGTKTLTHNSDGTRTFKVSIQGGIYTYAVNCTGSTTFTLTTIARATTPTLSATSVTMGNSVTITMDRASSSFTHKLEYSFAGSTGTIGTDLGTSKSWTVPTSLADKIPDAKSGTCTITCTTYKSTTKIGSKKVTLTLKVPTTAPTVSLTVEEAVANVKSKLGVYVKSLSKLKVTVSASSDTGATIASYSVSANGSVYNSNSFTTGLLKTSGDMVIEAVVTDSRGYKKTVTKTINVKNYSKPKVTTLKANRCNSSGTAQDNGTYAKVTYTASVTSLSGNTASYKIQYRATGASSWTTKTVTSASGSQIISGFNVDTTYEIAFVVADQFNTTTVLCEDLGTAFALVDYHSGGKGIAFGKVAEGDGFECDMVATFNKNVNFEGSKWIVVPESQYGSCYAPYSGYQPLMYRKIGNHVYIKGRIAVLAGYNGGDTIFTMPEGYRPSYTNLTLNPMTGANVARVYVQSSGNFVLEWCRKMSDGTTLTGAISWVVVDIDYFTD